jgi:hypothetical protein
MDNNGTIAMLVSKAANTYKMFQFKGGIKKR